MTEPIKRVFARQEAYLRLRDQILEGKLAPGTKLKDQALAIQLGISRTPVREALLRLEDEGFIQTKPNRSTLVSPIDFHNAFHLYSIIWTLEQLALNQAFEFIADVHIEQMVDANESFLQKMKEKDRIGALQADHRFHLSYIDLCANPELQKIIAETRDKLKRLDLFYFDKIKNAALSYEEHKQIIDALRIKNLPLTLKAIEHNWKASFSRFNL